MPAKIGRPPFTCHDAHPNDVLVGLRIKEAREESQPPLTMTDLAKRLGIHRQQLARHEDGRSRVRRDRLEQIAAHTGKPFAFFAAPLDREDSEMLRLVRAVPPQHREMVTAMLRRLADGVPI